MLLKVSAFHIYQHNEQDGDHQECHLCEQAIDNQVAELHLQSQISIAPVVLEQIEVIKTMGRPIAKVSPNNKPYFFLRPPPSLIA